MPTIAQTGFAAIDFESAGTSRGQTDVPIQIGIALWSPADGHGEAFRSFLHTDRAVTWSAQRVHGITTDQLADAPPLVSLWPETKRLLGGRAVVAHGHGTEKRFLRAFPGHPFGPWIDTLNLSRAAWPAAPSHSLGDLCAMLGLAPRVEEIAPGGQWHDALYDSIASLVILEHLVDSCALADSPLDVLLQPDLTAYHHHRR